MNTTMVMGTMHQAPNNQISEVEIMLFEDDAKWVKENNVKVSVENLQGMMLCYIETGKQNKDGEDLEVMEVVDPNQVSCPEAFSRGIHRLKLEMK